MMTIGKQVSFNDRADKAQMAGPAEGTSTGLGMPKSPARHRAESTNIISIQGGLGNQLFAWAFAHALKAQGSHVILDTVRCRGNRPFEIGGLVGKHQMLARPLGYAAVLGHKGGILPSRPTWGIPWQLAREPGFAFNQDFVAGLLSPSRRRNYVLGYFQSPKYFAGCEEQVRAAVRELLRGMLTEDGRTVADKLAVDPNSVAVHVRRGDYVSNQVASEHHGSLTADYYKTALEAVRDRGGKKVMWFSDDTDWVRAELARPEDTIATPSFTAGLTTAAGGEIALMASCSSRVIANSSFSWWAGWLGRDASPAFPVIAPARWLAGTAESATDLVPSSWTRF